MERSRFLSQHEAEIGSSQELLNDATHGILQPPMNMTFEKQNMHLSLNGNKKYLYSISSPIKK